MFQSIVDEGFKFPSADKAQSVSFAPDSSVPLGYASRRGNDRVVIAVRFDNANRSARAVEGFGIHVYNFDLQPEIIGYVIVPAGYVHRQALVFVRAPRADEPGRSSRH